jgi:hypothetical protein
MKDKNPWGFGRKSSGGTSLKKTRATRDYREEGRQKTRTARDYREEGRQRSSDRWIPFKFPERPTTVRSAEVAKEISHRRFGDREFIMSNPLDIENSEIAIRDFAI